MCFFFFMFVPPPPPPSNFLGVYLDCWFLPSLFSNLIFSLFFFFMFVPPPVILIDLLCSDSSLKFLDVCSHSLTIYIGDFPHIVFEIPPWNCKICCLCKICLLFLFLLFKYGISILYYFEFSFLWVDFFFSSCFAVLRYVIPPPLLPGAVMIKKKKEQTSLTVKCGSNRNL